MATPATETAAIAADRHKPRSGPEVFYRLILNGIDIDGRKDAVGQVIERAIAIHMRLTEATLAVPDFTAPQTEIAAHRAVFQLFLQAGLDQLVLFRSIHAIHQRFKVLLMSTEVSRHKLSGPSAAWTRPSSVQGCIYSVSRKLMSAY